MNNFSIIGLVGRAGAGKDTVASILQDAYGHIPVAFADALREEISEAFGVDIDALVNRYTKESVTSSLAISKCKDNRFVLRMVALSEDPHSPRSPRQIMRWWGTEFRRDCDSNTYWHDRLHERIEDHLRSGARKIAVTDVRFLNEAEFIRTMGGSIWRIRRDSADAVHADHQSESEQERIEADRSINNNRSLGSLVENVLNAYGLDHATRAN